VLNTSTAAMPREIITIQARQLHRAHTRLRPRTDCACAATRPLVHRALWLHARAQVGQCGNQVGCRFWELALREHAAHNKGGRYDDALSSFFANVDTRTEPPTPLPLGDGRGAIRTLRVRGARARSAGGLARRAGRWRAPRAAAVFAALTCYVRVLFCSVCVRCARRRRRARCWWTWRRAW
jgi:hypothetical protein